MQAVEMQQAAKGPLLTEGVQDIFIHTQGGTLTDAACCCCLQVLAFAPDVLLLCPCSRSPEAAMPDVTRLTQRPGFMDLPAVKSGRVYIIDHSYFSRPGPRLVDGVELLHGLVWGKNAGSSGDLSLNPTRNSAGHSNSKQPPAGPEDRLLLGDYHHLEADGIEEAVGSAADMAILHAHGHEVLQLQWDTDGAIHWVPL
jgi:hypothetical protein